MTGQAPVSEMQSGSSRPGGRTREVWVLAEHLEGHVSAVTYETAALAANVAAVLDGKVSVVVLGESAGSLALEIAGRSGSDTVGVITPGFPECLSETSRWVLGRRSALHGPPSFLLVPHTPAGWDLAPSLAVDLQASCITSVTDFLDDNGPVFSRQTFHGKLIEHLRPAGDRPAVITVMPGAFRTDGPLPAQAGRVRLHEMVPPAPAVRRTGRKHAPPDTPRLKDAEVIVAAGRGVGGPEHLANVRTLAGLFPHSALGASRPLCDRGWLPLHHQVGMTGQTVSPRLYIACGISGAVQHTMGIRHADLIVSINTDPDALFCRTAHCCVLEDLQGFLPVLIDKILERRK
jgi:electron transfer flavoprotein alpha subunit